jgi:hypothetical protein
MSLHKDLTGTDLHVNKLHAATHADGGTDELSVTDLADAGTAATAALDTDGALAANSATRVPAQSAVVTYVAAAIAAVRNGVSAAFDTLAEIATELALKANLAGATFTGDISVPDEAYDATAWNGSLEVPTKNAVRDKIETLTGVTDGDKGDITVSSSGTVWTIDSSVISNAKLRDSAALSVVGRSANSTGAVADIAAGTDKDVLRRSGTSIGFGTIDAAAVGSGVLAIARLATGTPDGTKFVRDDGTLASPSGTGAPASASYVTLGTDGTLSSERVLTAGTGISLTDGGAGSTITVTNTSPGGGLVLLESHSASASATLDFTTRNATGQSGASIQSDYDHYVIALVRLVAATTNSNLYLRVSNDGGSSYIAANYFYANHGWTGSGSSNNGNTGQAQIILNSTGIKGSSWGVCGRLDMLVGTTTEHARTWGQINYDRHSDGFPEGANHAGLSVATNPIMNAFRLLFNSGNITTGIVRLYGVAK